jgi:hypothetical protein
MKQYGSWQIGSQMLKVGNYFRAKHKKKRNIKEETQNKKTSK